MKSLGKNAKKPNKKTALELVRELRLKYDDSSLDDLILFFATRQKGVAKTAEQWVCRAVAIKDDRPALNYMYVEKGIAYGTDGKRAHAASTGLENGYYDPASLERVEFDGKFPEIERILELKGGGCATFSTNIEELSRVEFVGVIRYIHKPSDSVVSVEALREALNGDELAEVVIRDNGYWQGVSAFGRFTVMGVRRS